jgi:hypothetical protein
MPQSGEAAGAPLSINFPSFSLAEADIRYRQKRPPKLDKNASQRRLSIVEEWRNHRESEC